MSREVTELWSDAIGAAGTVIRYGHWGRAVLAFPSEQGKAWDFENNGMVGAVANLIDEGRLKLYCVDSYDAASWSNQNIPLEERARQHGRYESWILSEVVPWIYRDCGGEVRGGHPGLQPGRLPRGQLRAQAGRPLPAGHVLLRQLRPRVLARLGRARQRGVLQQPARLRGQPARRPPRLAARPGQPAAGVRPGPVGRHHRIAGQHQAVRRAARRARASGTSSTCGATTCPTTGPPGAPSSPITCHDSAERCSNGGQR